MMFKCKRLKQINKQGIILSKGKNIKWISNYMVIWKVNLPRFAFTAKELYMKAR